MLSSDMMTISMHVFFSHLFLTSFEKRNVQVPCAKFSTLDVIVYTHAHRRQSCCLATSWITAAPAEEILHALNDGQTQTSWFLCADIHRY